MKRYIGVAVLCLLAGRLSGEAFETQASLDRPERDKWFVYLDFNMDMYEDVYVKSLKVSDSTFASPKAPFLYDNGLDITSKTNNFRIGVRNNFIDSDESGVLGWYAGIGSSSTNLDLFSTGTIGAKGWGVQGGIQGDIFRFGSMLDRGIEIDCSIDAVMATGDSSGAIDESYDIMTGTVNAAAYYKATVALQDTTDTVVYIGGKVAYARTWLTLDLDAATASGSGDYVIDNQGMNQLFLVLGAKFNWESNRSTADLRITGSLDGSYTIGLRLLQTF